MMHRPQYCMPLVAHLDGMDWRDAHIFEWGSGASSLWWATMAKSYVGIEHKLVWGAKQSFFLASTLPDEDARIWVMPRPLLYREIFQLYIKQHSPSLIILDGRDRVACYNEISKYVHNSPWVRIILDDSQRARYAPILADLAGFPNTTFREASGRQAMLWDLR